MATTYQALYREMIRVIDADSNWTKAATPYFAEFLPATAQGRYFTLRFEGGGIVANGPGGMHTVHSAVVETMADTSLADTGPALALDYVQELAEIVAPATSMPLGEHGARAVYTGYEIEPVEGGEWSIIRVNFDITQYASP